MVSGTVACFFTCGYTEGGEMQAFLEKINPDLRFKQFLPNKTKKRKGSDKLINADISGLTGKPLVDKVVDVIGLRRQEIEQCSAIIIEDDRDDMSHEAAVAFAHDAEDRIRSVLAAPVPVLFFYASPEIESWFVSDWTRSFEAVYSSGFDDISRAAAKFFINRLHVYVKGLVSGFECIEDYGIVDGQYHKLSDEIISGFDIVKKELAVSDNANPDLVDEIMTTQNLYYSKRTHGSRMLRSIDPSRVASRCWMYFAPAFRWIQALGGPDKQACPTFH